MQPLAFDFEERQDTFTVGEVTEAIRAALGEFGSIWIAGEISGAKLAPSGHWYFTLKDQEASLKCACFKMQAMRLKVKPRDGLEVLARGRLDVYGPRGEYQFIVEAIRPQGEGALQIAFEQLKKKLQLEGLFDEERKRPIPQMPHRIGIVTSPTGAVIQDMIHVLQRRFPGLHVRLYPAQVQGEASVAELIRGLQYFSENPWAEVVILARGGGSLEDLMSFNDESVARAIADSSVPVIAAVGHQTDFTIADFVADLRAPTPSAAAELAVPEKAALSESVDRATSRLLQTVSAKIDRWRSRATQLGVERPGYVLQSRLRRNQQRVDEAQDSLVRAIRTQIEDHKREISALRDHVQRADVRVQLQKVRQRLANLQTRQNQAIRLKMGVRERLLQSLGSELRQLSPTAVLERGYAIVQLENGRVVREAKESPVDAELQITLGEGKIRARSLG
jgi:exodeoxyribonuclease VII large subunit